VKKLKSFDFERKGSTSRYEWDKLFDGNPWFIPVSEMNVSDGDSNGEIVARFRRTAYAAAQNRALKLQTQAIEDGLVIQVTGSR